MFKAVHCLAFRGNTAAVTDDIGIYPALIRVAVEDLAPRATARHADAVVKAAKSCSNDVPSIGTAPKPDIILWNVRATLEAVPQSYYIRSEFCMSE